MSSRKQCDGERLASIPTTKTTQNVIDDSTIDVIKTIDALVADHE